MAVDRPSSVASEPSSFAFAVAWMRSVGPAVVAVAAVVAPTPAVAVAVAVVAPTAVAVAVAVPGDAVGVP